MWRMPARQGKPIVPEIAGTEFAAPVAVSAPMDTLAQGLKIALIFGAGSTRPPQRYGLRNWACPAGPPVIFPSNQVWIMVATKPIDLCKGHDSLDELLKGCKRPEDLLGDAGLGEGAKIRPIERALGAELTAHRGYEAGAEPPADQTDRLNGITIDSPRFNVILDRHPAPVHPL